MFNRLLYDKTGDNGEAHNMLLNANSIHKDITCHRKLSTCIQLCSMYVPARILDRKTPEDRYYIYTSFCAEVENVCLNIEK